MFEVSIARHFNVNPELIEIGTKLFFHVLDPLTKFQVPASLQRTRLGRSLDLLS